MISRSDILGDKDKKKWRGEKIYGDLKHRDFASACRS